MERVCVCASVPTAYRSVPQPESLHLASIIRAALFISRSTNIGSPFSPSTRFPSLTLLKPSHRSSVKTHLTHPDLPPAPFPAPLLCRNTPDQHLITTTPQPGIEAHWLHNKTLARPRYFTPYECCSHRVLLENSPSRLLGGDHEWTGGQRGGRPLIALVCYHVCMYCFLSRLHSSLLCQGRPCRV